MINYGRNLRKFPIYRWFHYNSGLRLICSRCSMHKLIVIDQIFFVRRICLKTSNLVRKLYGLSPYEFVFTVRRIAGWILFLKGLDSVLARSR